MNRRRGARAGLAAAGLCALLVAGSISAAPTEAAWTDSEVASTTSVTAGALAAPTASTCIPFAVVIVGLQDVTLTWSSLQQGAQRVQITKGATTGTDIQGTTGSVITQTGSAGGTYQYSAKYTTAKLLGLVNLADLLGGSYTIRIYNGLSGTSWVSAPVTYNLNVILLGLGSSCTLVT